MVSNSECWGPKSARTGPARYTASQRDRARRRRRRERGRRKGAGEGGGGRGAAEAEGGRERWCCGGWGKRIGVTKLNQILSFISVHLKDA
jgi:hypothetical protein